MSDPTIRRFVAMLELLNRGRFVEKLDDHLEEAIRTLEALPNEKGSATINISITFAYESGNVEIKPSVKSKLPEEKAFSGTPMWTHEGGLSVQHPSQIDMFAGPSAVGKRGERDAG
jgi:hypothetical protein